jgi:putative redox protein
MAKSPGQDAQIDPAPTYAGRWVSAQVGAGFVSSVTARTHVLTADEPKALGGTDEGMTPYELLLAALSSCMAMTTRMYAARKGWPLDGAQVYLRTAPSRDPDRDVSVAGSPKGITRIERRIELTGDLTAEQRARLMDIADRCPVKRTLEGGLLVVSAPPEEE